MASAIQGHINNQLVSQTKKGKSVTITTYLKPKHIAFLHAANRDEAMRTLVELLDQAGCLHNKEKYFRALLEREKVTSTGIGMGVALPHAKLEGYQDFFIAIGIQQKQGIDWKALDGNPVRLIIMIGGPDNKQTEYLHLLSQLTLAIKDEERRKKLLKAKTADEVLSLFKGL